MANTEKQKHSPTLGQEILSVFGIFVAIFLLLCFVSFTLPHGSSLMSTADSNWGGRIGHFIALVLMSFMGVSAFWLIFLLLFFSVQVFLPGVCFQRIPSICAGCTGLLISSSALFATGAENTIELLGKDFPAGGHLGNFLFSFVATNFGIPGSILLFVSLFFVSLMASARFSPYACARKLLEAYDRMKTGDGESHEIINGPPLPALTRIKRRLRKRKAVKAEENEGGVPSVNEPVRLAEETKNFKTRPVKSGKHRLPGIGLLDKPPERNYAVDREYYYEVSKQLENKLADFGVVGKVVGISPGPVVTTYEFSPAPGVKINKIVSLADDLAMGLKAESVRIVGSIPGKAALGIEIPNPERQVVYVREILATENFQKSTAKLTIALGMDVVGNPVVANLAKMPHLLIAGATGAGKSVGINTIISSILMKASPDEVRMLMVDPKRIELSCYDDIPHLLHPVVVDPKMASRALYWAVREMERRYKVMEELRVKSIDRYNKVADTPLPLIIIVIDELADLMMVSSREVEDAVARLAQMARAAGMHLILATQRPSVDVLTGLIKANFPTRLSFKVSSKIDSRTILDTGGAEHLLGAGDMLFLPPGTAKLQRIHGAYISEQETEKIVDFLKKQGTAQYDESVLQIAEEPEEGAAADPDYDEKYDEAVAIVCESGQASISMLQRRLRVGYNRAARMIETMEREGLVGPADGSKPRQVLVRDSY